jgi:VanZ family protein
MRFNSFLPGIIWFVISAFLLALPGSDLPHADFFNIPYFDKYVHFAMFFLVTTLFCYPFIQSLYTESVVRAWFIKVTVYSVVYGIAMEFVQKYLVYGRSFDVIDIVFDTLGSVAGLLLMMKYHNKKIGPNRNRGRNQN